MRSVSLKKQFELGFAHYRAKNYEQTLVLLVPLIKKSTDANLLYAVAQSFRRLKQFSQSQQVFERLISLYKHPAFYCGYAGYFKDMGDLGKACEYFDDAIKLDVNYFDAYYNKALLLQEQKQLQEAISCYLIAYRINPNHAGTTLGLGQSYSGLAQFSHAIALYEHYITNNNNNDQIKYQLGKALLDISAFEKAKAVLQECKVLFPKNRIYRLAYITALESCSLRDNALEQYRYLLNDYPLDIEIHDRIFQLLWQQDSVDYFFEYHKAFLQNPSDKLSLEYARKLIKVDELATAKLILECYVDQVHDESHAYIMLAHVVRELGDFQQALAILDVIQTKNSIDQDAIFERVITLLCLNDFSQAFEYAEILYSLQNPTQGAIALFAAVLRMSNRHHEYSQIFNFTDLVGVFDLMNEESADLHECLVKDVLTLHNSNKHPVEQSLRLGTQTQGDLFNSDIPSISAFKEQLSVSINTFIRSHSLGPMQQFNSNDAEIFEYSASWSVNLKESGFHVNHYHNTGVLSACYYLTTTGVTDDGAGWLQFGQPELSRWLKLDAEFFVKPKIGRLVIFPSYMWHGTTPKSVSGERLTIAFDLCPIKKTL